jgi:mono/diheme cytochrome c family protein
MFRFWGNPVVKFIGNKSGLKLLFSGLFLTLTLQSCGSVDAEDPLDEVLPEGSAEFGLTAYENKCLDCHGTNLNGDSGPSLLNVTETEIRNAVRLGSGSMPSFTKTEITSQDLSDLIQYITTY